MDIENVWQRSGGSDDALNKMIQQKDFSNLHSKLPLKKLKKNLLIGLLVAVLITAFYVILFFFIDIWQVHTALAIAILFNILVGFDTWKLYTNIKVNVSTTNSLKDELQKNYSGFQRWWRIQKRLGLFVYPIREGYKGSIAHVEMEFIRKSASVKIGKQKFEISKDGFWCPKIIITEKTRILHYKNN